MMKLGIKKSKFAEVGNIKIPAIFYNRYKTGDSKIDGMFGNGILPGCAFTVTAQAGTGKCHAPDQEIEVFGDEELINKLNNFIKNS